MKTTGYGVEIVRRVAIRTIWAGSRFYDVLAVILLSAAVNLLTSIGGGGLSMVVTGVTLLASGCCFFVVSDRVKAYIDRAEARQELKKGDHRLEHLAHIVRKDSDCRDVVNDVKVLLWAASLLLAAVANAVATEVVHRLLDKGY